MAEDRLPSGDFLEIMEKMPSCHAKSAQSRHDPEMEQRINKNSSSISAAFLGTSTSSIGVVILTFASGVLISRALGPEGRGEYGAILLFAQLAAMLFSLSFFDGIVVILGKGRREVSSALPTILTVSFAISLASTVLVLVLVQLFTFGRGQVDIWFVSFFASIMILTHSLTQGFSAAERSQMQFSMLNFARASAPAAFTTLILLAWLWIGSDLSVEYILALFLIGKLPVIAIWMYRYRGNMTGSFDGRFATEALSVGLRLHVAVVLTTVSTQIDRLFAIGSWEAEQVGQYFVAFSAVGAGYSTVTTALNTVLLPYFSGSMAAERRQQIARVMRITLLIVGFVVIVGFILLPMAIPILYGAEFEESAALALWMLIALAPLPLRAIMLEASRSLGHGRPSVEMALGSLAVMIVGYFISEFSSPKELIATLGISNLAATLIGGRHLLRSGDLTTGSALLPRRSDVELLLSAIRRIIHKSSKQ